MLAILRQALLQGFDLRHLAAQADQQSVMLEAPIAPGGLQGQGAHFLQAEARLLTAGNDLQALHHIFRVVAVAIAQALGLDQAAGLVESQARCTQSRTSG